MTPVWEKNKNAIAAQGRGAHEIILAIFTALA
jgi:hypothetical protein